MSTVVAAVLVVAAVIAVRARAAACRRGPLRTDPALAERAPLSPLAVDGFAPVRERTGDGPADRLDQAFRVSERR